MAFLITKDNSILFPFKTESYPIYKTEKGQNNKALIRGITLMEKYISHYSKGAFYRIDVRPLFFTQDNKIISSFLSKQIKIFEKQYCCIVSYFFAREQNSSSKQHYHVALFFSGHKVNHPERISHEIKNNWKIHCSGSVHFVDHPMHIIERGNKRSIEPAIYRLSYLTKNHTKERNGKGASYGCSRLKYKNDIPDDNFLFVNPEITYRNFQKYKINCQS